MKLFASNWLRDLERSEVSASIDLLPPSSRAYSAEEAALALCMCSDRETAVPTNNLAKFVKPGLADEVGFAPFLLRNTYANQKVFETLLRSSVVEEGDEVAFRGGYLDARENGDG